MYVFKKIILKLKLKPCWYTVKLKFYILETNFLFKF